MTKLTHTDADGRIRMVDVSDKRISGRIARARALVHMKHETFMLVCKGRSRKGNVLEAARIAGIMAAKKTHELIPLCHQIALRHISVDFYPMEDEKSIMVEASAKADDKTGVEMEALVAVSIAALTIYDMCKAVDRGICVSDIRLVYKSGGKSGEYVFRDDEPEKGGQQGLD